MDSAEIAQILERFVRSSFGIAEDDLGFSCSVDLFESGYIDSVGIIETLAYISDTFGVDIPDQALLSDAFASIEGMTEVIAGLIAQGTDAGRIVQMSYGLT